jgi:hypothetical protein
MKISYLFDAEKNIYFKKVSGEITLKEAISSLQDSSFYDLTKNLYIVEDVRDVVYKFPLKKLYSFINNSQQHLPQNILIFQSLITHSKEVIVFGNIFKTVLSSHKYKLSIFSEPEKAEEWVIQKQKVYGTVVSI